jgi:DNA-binding CsgD family transcriptional regulator
MNGDLIGREVERGLATWLLTAEPLGSRGLVLTGEPGIGKTTVLRHVLAVAGEVGALVLEARPVLSESTLSFAGLGDLLRGLDTDRRALPPPRRRALEVAMLEVPEPEQAVDLRAVGLGLMALLEGLSSSHPVLVAVDDAHWLDAASSAALSFAARRVLGADVRWIVTRRPNEMAGLDLAEVGRERVREHTVAGLRPTDLKELLERRLGVRLSRPVMATVGELSRGNPFYALELARHRLDRSSAAASGMADLPASLTALVGSRIDDLPAPVRGLLATTALAAHPTVELLSQVAGVREATVRRRLEVARRAQVVTVTDEVTFTHPLLAAAVVQQTSHAERSHVHRGLAHHVAGREERARHAALVSDAPNEEVAAQLEVAAIDARGRGAAVSAADLIALAVARTPDARTVESERRRLLRADLAFQLGDTGAAGEVLLPLQSAQSSTVRAQACLLLARIAWVNGPAQDVHRYGDLALQAATDSPADTVDVRVALAHLSRHDRDRGVGHARAAVELTDHLVACPSLLQCRALTALLDVESDRGYPVQQAMLRRALHLSPDVEPGRVQDSPHYYLGTVLLMQDDLDHARRLFLDCVVAAEQRADDGSLTALWDQLSLLEILAGNWSVARSYALRHVSTAQATEQELQAFWGRQTINWIDIREGATQADAEATLLVSQARASSDLMTLAFALVMAAESAYLDGQVAAAADALREVEEIARTIHVMSPNAFRHGADLVEALVESGDVDAAQDATAELTAAAERSRLPWANAAAARSRAVLAAARGRLDPALAAAESSVTDLRALGMPYELGRSLLVMAGVLRRRRSKGAAGAALTEAESLFRELGARPWVDIATRRYQALGLGRRSDDVLTPTELRVADLVSQGLTNPEVAARLSVSRKTVEFNLSKVYRKLAIRNRTQLPAALTSKGASNSGEMPGSSDRSRG